MNTFRITYVGPLGNLQRAQIESATLLNAMSLFNTMDRTSGFDAGDAIYVDVMDLGGAVVEEYMMSGGRYGVPLKIGPRS